MIDLSSDTATRPSEGMRRAMAEAEVGDEQKREDPTTNALQQQAAAMLGKEAALFLPSATLSNLIALKTHLRPGDEFIATENSHIVVWEGGGLRLSRRSGRQSLGDRARHLHWRTGQSGCSAQ